MHSGPLLGFCVSTRNHLRLREENFTGFTFTMNGHSGNWGTVSVPFAKYQTLKIILLNVKAHLPAKARGRGGAVPHCGRRGRRGSAGKATELGMKGVSLGLRDPEPPGEGFPRRRCRPGGKRRRDWAEAQRPAGLKRDLAGVGTINDPMMV